MLIFIRVLSDYCRPFSRLPASLFFATGMALTPSAQADCWGRAGMQYGIDPLLLVAIATVESRLESRAINKNKNGTYDIGLMQVNSVHLPRLAKQGITRGQLFEPCISVMAGAQILSGFIRQHGYGWKAVGAYNAGSAANRSEIRRIYIKKVWQQYERLLLERRRVRRSLVQFSAGLDDRDKGFS